MSTNFNIGKFLKILILIVFFINMSYFVTGVAETDFKTFREFSKKYVEDEILVKFKDTTSDFSIMSTVQLFSSDVKREIGRQKLLLLKLKEGQNVDEAISNFKKNTNVEYAQPNFIYKIMSTTPNDTYYSNLWGLKNTGQTISNSSYITNNPGTPGMDMDMELAWDYVTDCSSIIVAVIDTGVNYNHVDLAGNMWNGAVNHGYDFVDDDEDPIDFHGHGTHVAGTIGAVGNNGMGTTGICWDVPIMAVRVLDTTGTGTTADIISGVYYAVDNGAKIFNMSIGGTNFDQAYYDAIGYAKNNSVIVVAAAGNEGIDNDVDGHHYPCDFDHDNIIGVAALDQSYELASFSNYGNVSVDVGAPGTNIQSEWCGTETSLGDPLTSGWTEGGTDGWSYAIRDFGFGDLNLLVDPPDWGPPSWGLYSNNADDRIWKTFDINGVDAAVLNYAVWLDVEEGNDGLLIFCDNGTEDPFVNGYQLAGWTGSTEGQFFLLENEIPSSYITSTSTIGFGLVSNNSIQDYGVAILYFGITGMTTNNTTYNTKNGTSMATPHVSGLAALIWTFNPTYTYREVIESVKNGGEQVPSLNNKTTTGRAINGWGSLRYIKAPTGVVITKN